MAGSTGHASAGDFDRVLVVDFGAQYAQLIARRVREAHVFSEIVSRDVTSAEIRALAPAGIILSGGPASVYADDAYEIDGAIFELGIPVAGYLLRTPGDRACARGNRRQNRFGRIRPGDPRRGAGFGAVSRVARRADGLDEPSRRGIRSARRLSHHRADR